MGRAIRLLNLRRLARVRLRMVIAVLAVAAGSSLALSVIIVESSTQYSINRLNQQVAGAAALRVVGATSTGGINFQALADVSSTPGVKAVIPVIEAITVVRTTHAHNQAVLAIGVTCGAAAVFGGVGCPSTAGTSSPQAGGGLSISASLKRQLSASSWLETNTGIDALASATSLASLDTVNRGDVVVMPLALAQQQFDRMGRLDDIFVITSPGVSTTTLQHRLEHAIGPWDGVVDATAAPPAVSLAIGEFTPILGILALVASAIAVVLVYNVISLSLEERRRERAMVAAVGAPPLVLIVGPLLESGLLGAVGGLLGALGGIVLARPIVSTLSRITLGLVGIPITLHTSSSTYLIGLGLGTLIGLLAAAQPVRRAMRADIAAEISGRERRERTSSGATLRAALLYTVVAGGGAVLSWAGERNGSLQSWQPAATLLGFVVTFVFAVVALGAWAPVVIRLISRRGHIKRGVARLGVANLLREPGRTSVMAVAIGAAIAVAFITASFNRAIDQDIAAGFAQSSQSHGLSVSTVASGNGFNTDGQIPDRVLTALSHLPGVTGVDRFGGQLTGHSSGQLTLVESESRPSFDYTVFAGSDNPAAFLRGGILVGANLARRDGLHPGSRLALDTPSGVARLLVQGIWNNGDAAGDNVYIPPDLENRLFGRQQSSGVSLIVANGTSPATVAAQARAAHLGPYLKFRTPTQELSNADSSTSGNLAPFVVLQRALLLVSFISVLSTLLLIGIQRRREFGLLAAVGMTPRELFRMVIAEGLTVSLVAVLLGAGLGFLLLDSLLSVTPMLIGYHDTYSPDLLSLAVYGPIAVIIALIAAAWPGRLAARTPILEALQYE